MSTASDLLKYYQHVISELRLIPGPGGVFDVSVGDNLIYSKGATGRHAEPGEVLDLFAELVGPEVGRYGT